MYQVWEDKATLDCWTNENYERVATPAWAKMVDTVSDDLEYDDYVIEVGRILKKYKAKMIRPTTYPHYIRFPNEKMACWFLLEWS